MYASLFSMLHTRVLAAGGHRERCPVWPFSNSAFELLQEGVGARLTQGGWLRMLRGLYDVNDVTITKRVSGM